MARRLNKSDPKLIPAFVALIPFAEAFVRLGGDVETVLRRNRIPETVFSNPTMLIEAKACYAAMEDMANLIGDPFFGAKLAIEAAKTGTPAIRNAAADAATLGDFLSKFIVEIDNQLSNVRHRLEVSFQAASFEIRRMIAPGSATKQIDAVNVTFCVTLFQSGLGELFDTARITVLAPTTEGVPANFLPKRCLNKSSLNGVKIIFPPEWLWAPFSLGWRLGDAPRSRKVIADDDDVATLAYFRSILENNIDSGDLPLHRFAQILELHPRRVQRLLSANRTSYRQLKEDVRRAIAFRMLSETSAPVSEIASRIGFSHVTAFDRAFKLWTGKTPTDFRSSEKLPGND